MGYTLATTSTGSGVDLTSKIALATFTAPRDCIVRPVIELSGLNGAASTITLYALKLTAEDGRLREQSISFPKTVGTDTTAGEDFPADGWFLLSGQKLTISAKSTNGSDTTTPAFSIAWVTNAAADVVEWLGVIPAVLAGGTGNLVQTVSDGAIADIASGATVIRANDANGDAIPTEPTIAAEVWTYQTSRTLTSALPLTAQETANALKLAPAAGSPAAGSVYAKLNAITTIGTGSDTVTLTFTDGTNPISGAEVWVSSDSGGATIVAGTLTTDDDGEVTMLLDAGTTYYAWLKKSGVNPILGSAFVASAD